MGSFILEGFLEINPLEEFTEKEGLKNEDISAEARFIKLRVGKFQIFKRYVSKSLEDLVQERNIIRMSVKQQQAKLEKQRQQQLAA